MCFRLFWNWFVLGEGLVSWLSCILSYVFYAYGLPGMVFDCCAFLHHIIFYDVTFFCCVVCARFFFLPLNVYIASI